MKINKKAAVFLVGMMLFPAAAQADWVELTNGDIIQGTVVSLDDQRAKLKSENFGEMEIPRDKVSLIGLGDRPEPTPAPVVQPQSSAGSGAAALQGPQLNQLLQQALGGQNMGDLQENFERSRRGLQDLQKDMGPSSAKALDGYIRMFEMLGNIAPSLEESSGGSQQQQTE